VSIRLFIVTILVHGACSAERVSQAPSAVGRLIGKWQRTGTAQPGLPSEVTTWELYSNGTFRWHFASDFALSSTGAWAVSATSAERGIMFLATFVNGRACSSGLQVLSFESRNGRLRLGEMFYQRTPFANRDVPPRVRKEDHEAVASPQRDSSFPLWAAITANDWRIESTPRSGDQNRYSLMRDGTYNTHFAAIDCHYSGTWSLISSTQDAGKIRLSIPDNRCDRRGPRDAFVREIPLTMKNGKLCLYQTVYVSVPRRDVNRGP
jgi:hypothetical protein